MGCLNVGIDRTQLTTHELTLYVRRCSILSLASNRVRGVDLTYSYKDVLPQDILDRYTFLETRNAAAAVKASNPDHLKELVKAPT